MKALLKLMMCLLMGIVPISALADTYTYTVKRGDTLTGIAKQYGLNYVEICKENALPDCDRIITGQELTIPSIPVPTKPKATGPKKKTVPIWTTTGIARVKSEVVPVSSQATVSAQIREWRKVGNDPVLPSWVRKTWLSSEEVRLDPRQERKLRLQGLDDSQIREVKDRLKRREYLLIFREEGYEWDFMAFGSGEWGRTRNVTGEAIPVFALPPTSQGYQVDLVLGCGNVAGKKVVLPAEPKPEPKPLAPQEAEKRLACERIGAFWAQISQHGVSGTARFACLFQVNKDWKVGPTIGLGGSRFDDHKWIEVQNFFGGGFEVRGKNIAGFDAMEFVVMVGYGSSKGHSADGLVDKLKSSGFDVQLAAQLRKMLRIDPKTTVTVRFMPFANIPLTGVETDILWKNMVVKRENGRHLTVGAIMRFEFQREGLGFKPEFTLGIWRISDVDNPIGWKVLVGASILDNVWRIGAGLQFPGPIWLVELEYNPAWGWLQLNAQVASDALHKGAMPTCKALKMKRCARRNTASSVNVKSVPVRVATRKVMREVPEVAVLPQRESGWNDRTYPSKVISSGVDSEVAVAKTLLAAQPLYGFNQR